MSQFDGLVLITRTNETVASAPVASMWESNASPLPPKHASVRWNVVVRALFEFLHWMVVGCLLGRTQRYSEQQHASDNNTRVSHRCHYNTVKSAKNA